MMKKPIKFLVILLSISFQLTHSVKAQDVIDVVDPYEMKVSRTKQADTFYFTQNAVNTSAAKQKMDTLRTYDVFLEERPTPFGIAYMCNGTEVTKQKYFEYKRFWNAAGACQPCMLYTFDDKNQLKYIAYQYEDCLCGSYVEYYQDGTKKLEGQFKQNPTSDWQNIKLRNLCNIRDGIWTYFLPNGVEEKTEIYIDGKLKNTTDLTLNTSAKTKKIMATTSEQDETESKKGLIQRLKDKNKQTDN